jgi:hypothetical protein
MGLQRVALEIVLVVVVSGVLDNYLVQSGLTSLGWVCALPILLYVLYKLAAVTPALRNGLYGLILALIVATGLSNVLTSSADSWILSIIVFAGVGWLCFCLLLGAMRRNPNADY